MHKARMNKREIREHKWKENKDILYPSLGEQEDKTLDQFPRERHVELVVDAQWKFLYFEGS